MAGAPTPAIWISPARPNGSATTPPRQRIVERLELWRKGPVTDLLVTAPDPHTLRVLAELNSS